jgi:hypothetical protein
MADGQTWQIGKPRRSQKVRAPEFVRLIRQGLEFGLSLQRGAHRAGQAIAEVCAAHVERRWRRGKYGGEQWRQSRLVRLERLHGLVLTQLRLLHQRIDPPAFGIGLQQLQLRRIAGIDPVAGDGLEPFGDIALLYQPCRCGHLAQCVKPVLHQAVPRLVPRVFKSSLRQQRALFADGGVLAGLAEPAHRALDDKLLLVESVPALLGAATGPCSDRPLIGPRFFHGR